MYIWRLWCVKGFVTLTGLSFKKKKNYNKENPYLNFTFCLKSPLMQKCCIFFLIFLLPCLTIGDVKALRVVEGCRNEWSFPSGQLVAVLLVTHHPSTHHHTSSPLLCCGASPHSLAFNLSFSLLHSLA